MKEKVCKFNLINKPIVRGIAIFLVVWITNFNMSHWSGTYRYLFYDKKVAGELSIDHEVCGDDCWLPDWFFKHEDDNAWGFELWLKEECWLVYCCILTSCISLFLLKFKDNRLLNYEEDGNASNFLRTNREIVQTSINIATAFFVPYKTTWDIEGEDVDERNRRTTWGILVMRWVSVV